MGWGRKHNKKVSTLGSALENEKSYRQGIG